MAALSDMLAGALAYVCLNDPEHADRVRARTLARLLATEAKYHERQEDTDGRS